MTSEWIKEISNWESEYLMSGKLPNDGNHDGMKNHRPVSLRHNNLDSLD